MTRTLAVLLAAMAVAVTSCRRDLPPTLPELSGDLTGWPGDTLMYSAVAIDPEGGALSYLFSWGDTCGAEWTPPSPSGDTVTGRHVYADSGTAIVKVQVRDEAEQLSEWSNPLEVSLGRIHPTVPTTPTGPDSGITIWSYEFLTTTMNPYGESLSVQFDWGDSTPQSWGRPAAQEGTYHGYHGYTVCGTFEVRARAVDAGGWITEWSTPHRVTITSHPPYEPPAPFGPRDGEKDSVHGLSCTAADPDGDSVSIRFSWGDGDTSDWSALVKPGDTVTLGHSWSTFGTYEVKAQARDADGGVSAWSPGRTFDTRPALLWCFETGRDIRTAPAVAADGTVYVGSDDGCLYAVNPDGSLKWQYRAGTVRSSPVVADDGTVCFGSASKHVYALQPDGTVEWTYKTRGEVRSSPAIAADGNIYCGSRDNYLHALASDGTEKWCYDTGSNVESSPAIGSDGTVYFGSNNNHIYALNPDGTLRWRFATGDDVLASMGIGPDATIYVGSEDNYLYAFNPDGSLKWRYGTDADVESSPAIGSDGTVYFGSNDNYIYALNPDGTLRWRVATKGNVTSSPALAADGTVYCGSWDNYLYALNPDGTLKWRCRAGRDIRSSPAIGPDGTVYFGSDDDYLYAIEGGSPLATAPWPKFHHDSRNTGRVGGE